MNTQGSLEQVSVGIPCYQERYDAVLHILKRKATAHTLDPVCSYVRPVTTARKLVYLVVQGHINASFPK